MCPVLGGTLLPERMVCHCLLIETAQGLVLVDTGFGLDDIADPSRLGPTRTLLRSRFDPDQTAARQVEALGFSRRDVQHIVLTHMDLDHAGGLADFPWARVHVMRKERELADRRPLPTGPMRYRPAQWAHGPDFRTYDVSGEPWHGFAAVRQLEGLPPEILLVPVDGHTLGHAAVAVDLGPEWLVHCGDAYFFHAEVDPDRPRCPPGLDVFRRATAMDNRRRAYNLRRLQDLARDHGDGVRLFCAHDEEDLLNARARAAERGVIAAE